MKILRELSPEALAFVEARLRFDLPGGTTGLVSLQDNGQIAGAVAFTPPACGSSNLHIAAASRVWFTPDFCRAMFLHGFETLQLRRITASVEASNRLCRRLTERVGFSLEGVLQGFDFGDLLLYGMLKENCIWVA